jgi:hypothetical protein
MSIACGFISDVNTHSCLIFNSLQACSKPNLVPPNPANKSINLILFKHHRFTFWNSKESCLYTLKGIVSRIDVIFDWSEKRRFFDIQTTCISNWLIWKQKVCKTFLRSSRNISIIIVTQNSLKRVSQKGVVMNLIYTVNMDIIDYSKIYLSFSV